MEMLSIRSVRNLAPDPRPEHVRDRHQHALAEEETDGGAHGSAVTVAHEKYARHAVQLLQHRLEELPAVHRRAEVAHVDREDFVEVRQRLGAAPRGSETVLLALADTV